MGELLKMEKRFSFYLQKAKWMLNDKAFAKCPQCTKKKRKKNLFFFLIIKSSHKQICLNLLIEVDVSLNSIWTREYATFRLR